MSTRVAYLGPAGTYAEQAARSLAELEKLHKPDFIPCIGMQSVIEQAAKKTCDVAVVPIENSEKRLVFQPKNTNPLESFM